jgi:PKD repeat protein
MAMRGYLVIIIMLGLVCLIGGVVAESVYNSTITSSKEWVIANGKDQATITVTLIVPNGTVLGSGVPVSFALATDSLDKGTLSLSSTLTDSSGASSTIFTTSKKSGNANIIITASYNGTTTYLNYTQKIDHDVPYYWTVTSPSSGSVGTQTYFNVSYTDQWGNVIDHRNPANPYTIQLDIGSPSGTAAFVTSGGNVISTSQQLDDYGNLSVIVLLDTRVGQNNIHIYPFYSAAQGGAIPDEYPAIIGIANGAPVSLTLITNPDPPQMPADQVSTIALQYTLYDQFGNPTVGQNITLRSNRGDSYPGLMSNDFGVVGYLYGPTSMAGNITLTATAESPKADGSFATLIKYVTFYNTTPVNWVLSADPQTMPSLDANPGSMSKITAQVMDQMGNPVANQTVTFTLGTPSYDLAIDNVTSQPALTQLSVNTLGDGNAITYFIPGGFSADSTTPYYNPQATGRCTVTATWNGVQQNVELIWKNYPYLSAYTSVSPSNVTVNGTVNVTVKLTGDGWALSPSPIDAVILIDRSGSMADRMSDGNTEIANAKTGALLFADMMNSSSDRLAVVSYSGTKPNIDTTVNQGLTTNLALVKAAINGLNPTSSTGTRDGLYQSIQLLKSNPNANPKAVRAVILLTDGDYNWLGDPVGRGTGYYPGPDAGGYTGYSTSALEPNKYMIYDGLGCSYNAAAVSTATPTPTPTATPAPTYRPTAYFTVSHSGNYGVKFTDGSTGGPTSWSWNFGDGRTSTSQSPTHTYSGTGTYTVTETVTNSAGSNSYSPTLYVTRTTVTITSGSRPVPTATPTPAPTPVYSPTAYFTVSPTSYYGYGVKFTDGSTGGTPRTYSWNFGDGSTANTQSPTHTYSAAGIYTVTETVTNSAGSSTYAPKVAVDWGSASISTSSTCTDGTLTEQNMSIFASDNKIRLYMIAYAATSNFNAQAIADMKTMANSTGGFYAAAPDEATLALIYTEIAGDLKTTAGVNTTMNLSFQNVNLTNVTVPGADVLSYVPQTEIIWQNKTTTYQDQSSQWSSNTALSFNIGTINLSETWQATFQLKVLKAGSIELFGPASTVVFNNGADSMIIPPVYITAYPNNTSATGPVGRIVLSNLAVTQTGTISEFVPLQWNTNFPGTASSAWERLYYSTTDQPAGTCGSSSWSQFDDKSTGIPPGDSSETSQLDVRSLPQGTYYICVIAQDPISGALPAVPIKTNGILVKAAGKSYIKLE